MKGWSIFRHSVHLVFSNLDHALRVSLVLYLVQAAGQVVMFLNPPEMQVADGMNVPVATPDALMLNLVFGTVAILASLWIAVAWHRFVLVEEYPSGWIPRWHGANMLGYLGRSIILGLVVVVAAIIATLPFGLILAVLPGLAPLVPFVMIGLGAFLFFRLAVILPASALGRKMTLSEAWKHTKGETGTLLTLTLIVIGASIVIHLPSMVQGDDASLLTLVYALVVNWFATIVGVSVLTTLYGLFVENRTID